MISGESIEIVTAPAEGVAGIGVGVGVGCCVAVEVGVGSCSELELHAAVAIRAILSSAIKAILPGLISYSLQIEVL